MVTKHNAYDVQLASKTNPAARYVLATDYAALEAERDLLREDLDAAAGELLIPVPIPGSIESKMLIANRLLRAERDELKRRLDAILTALKPAQIKWSKTVMDSPEYHAWCLVAPLYGQALAIAEGRDNG